MFLSSLQRWCRARDPLVAIAVRWGGLTVAYSDRHRRIRYQTFPSEAQSVTLPSRCYLDSVARAARVFIPRAARRCGFSVSGSYAYASTEAPFDAQGMLVAQTSSSIFDKEGRDLFFTVRMSMARRCRALAARADLDVDCMTHSAVTTFHALRALGLFSYADTIGVIGAESQKICIEEYDRHGWISAQSFAVVDEGSPRALAESLCAFLSRRHEVGCLVEDGGALSRAILKCLSNSSRHLLDIPSGVSVEAFGMSDSGMITPGILSCIGLLAAHKEWEEGLVV